MTQSDSTASVDPTREQLRAFLAHPDEQPVVMLNLLKFRERAAYDADDDAASGKEAYQRYARVALRHIAARGGRVLFAGSADGVVVGDGQTWDEVALIEYPSRAAFLDMMRDPEYLAATAHRRAGLERTVLIATTSSRAAAAEGSS